MSAKKAAIQNLVIYGLFALLASWVFTLTADFPQPLLPGYPGSAMFPRLAVGLMGLFSTLGFIRELFRLMSGRSALPVERSDTEGGLGSRSGASGAVLSCIVLMLFVAIIEYVGMEPAVFLFCSLMTYVATRRVGASLVSGVASVLVVYLVFVQGLSVFMPLAFLPRYLSW